MAIERDNAGERQARVDRMVNEFRSAQHRRLVERGIALWKQAEATQSKQLFMPARATEKVH
jgi:hypothetical protein